MTVAGVASTLSCGSDEPVWDWNYCIPERSKKPYAYFHPTNELFLYDKPFEVRFLALLLAAATPVYTLGVMAARTILVLECFFTKEQMGSHLLGIVTSPFYGMCLLVTFIACIFFGMYTKPLASEVQKAWLKADYRDDVRFHAHKAKKEGNPEANPFHFMSSKTVIFLAFCFVSRGSPKTLQELKEPLPGRGAIRN